MRKLAITILLGASLMFHHKTSKATESFTPCPKSPTTIETCNEIAIRYNQQLPTFFNELTPEERVFIYYLFRASLPSNRIAADQLHRNALELTDLFETIVRNKKFLKEKVDETFALNDFITDSATYLTYLWTNHSQYFAREHANHKRTPEVLGLNALSRENLILVMHALQITDADETFERLADAIFNKDIEPTVTVPGSIDQSAVNIYSSEFTDKDFESLSAEEQKSINAYFYIDKTDEKRTPKSQLYSIDGKYGDELSVCMHWLQKAYEHTKKHTESFDKHFATSLEYLIMFLQTGNEEFFKQHSIEWLKTDSRIDYCFGFIENYIDPKSYRGAFQSEVTIKSIDMKKINKILPSLESKLPFPQEFKRDGLESGEASVPNASINIKVFSAGELGPMNIVAAYCLPNYADIRSGYGSKQIIYHSERGLGEILEPEKNRMLFNLKEQADWLKPNDPDGKLGRDIWMLQVILHETLGHGSGKLTTHIFKDGEDLTIAGKTYNVDDSIPVTSGNIQQLLAGYDQTLEELRAEIIALYTSIAHYDEFAEAGLLGDWPKILEKKQMVDQLIINMAGTGLRRLLVQKRGSITIAGDHARANYTIMNYLISYGGLELVKETVIIDDKKHIILGLKVTDQKKTIENIKKLAILVQTIKSTGDGIAAKNLIETYGTTIKHPEHIDYMKDNLEAVMGNIKVSATIFPNFTPIIDKDSEEIVDIAASWPRNFLEQYLHYSDIAMSVMTVA